MEKKDYKKELQKKSESDKNHLSQRSKKITKTKVQIVNKKQEKRKQENI